MKSLHGNISDCNNLVYNVNVGLQSNDCLFFQVKMKNIQKESIRQFLVPLFQEMNCQTQRQSDRYNIFSIVGYIVENHLGTVAAMGSDFVFGIISLADGETDPSNLLLLFQFLPLFLKNVDLGHLMEEMFGLLACYFPIDYSNVS